MVFMIEALSARENTHPEDCSDPKVLSLACRIAAELGADIVKSQYPGSLEAVAEIAETCPVPLLLAGGAKKGTLEEAYDLARASMKAGARGLVFGRNIFEAEDISKEVQTYKNIVHATGQEKI